MDTIEDQLTHVAKLIHDKISDIERFSIEEIKDFIRFRLNELIENNLNTEAKNIA